MGSNIRDDNYFGPDPYSYLDTREFRDYAAAIGKVIDAHGSEGATTRQIHEALGDDARREWTADAIDSLKDIKTAGVLVTRYIRAGATEMSKTVHDWKNYPDRPGALPTILKQEQLTQ